MAKYTYEELKEMDIFNAVRIIHEMTQEERDSIVLPNSNPCAIAMFAEKSAIIEKKITESLNK